jgi:hypothetical protein
MKCLCGASVAIRETGKPGCARAECTKCHEVYDYSCWPIRTTSQRTFHKIEAFPRGATVLGRDLAGRCQECAACQEWLMQPSTAPACTGQEYRKRGIVEKGRT